MRERQSSAEGLEPSSEDASHLAYCDIHIGHDKGVQSRTNQTSMNLSRFPQGRLDSQPLCWPELLSCLALQNNLRIPARWLSLQPDTNAHASTYTRRVIDLAHTL